MQVSATDKAAASTDADTVAVGVFEGEELAAETPAEVSELLASGEARGSFKSLALTHADGKRWLLVGLGARDDFTPERARVAAAAARERAREISTRTLCWEAPPRQRRRRSPARSWRDTCSRDYRFERFKSAPRRRRLRAATPPQEPRGPDRLGARRRLEAAVAEAALVAEAVNGARDLQNRPGNDLTPTALAEHAQALAREIDGLSVEVEGREGIDGPRHGRVRRRRAGLRRGAGADHAAL